MSASATGSSKQIDLLESLVVGPDDEAEEAAADRAKDAKIRGEESQAIDTPFVGDDLEVYRKSNTEERERQFKDTLKLVASLRMQLKQTNEGVDLVERMFGESVFELFDWLMLFFGGGHPAEIEAVVPRLTSTWLEVGNLFKSTQLTYVWLEFIKSVVNAAEVLKRLPESGVYLEIEFLRDLVGPHSIGKTESAQRMIAEWHAANKRPSGKEKEKQAAAFNDFLKDWQDVFEKSETIAIEMTKLAPSISIEKSTQALAKHAFFVLEQAIALHGVNLALGKLEFHQGEILRFAGDTHRATSHRELAHRTKEEIILRTRSARHTRAQDVQHMIAIGRSLAQKSDVINKD